MEESPTGFPTSSIIRASRGRAARSPIARIHSLLQIPPPQIPTTIPTPRPIPNTIRPRHSRTRTPRRFATRNTIPLGPSPNTILRVRPMRPVIYMSIIDGRWCSWIGRLRIYRCPELRALCIATCTSGYLAARQADRVALKLRLAPMLMPLSFPASDYSDDRIARIGLPDMAFIQMLRRESTGLAPEFDSPLWRRFLAEDEDLRAGRCRVERSPGGSASQE